MLHSKTCFSSRTTFYFKAKSNCVKITNLLRSATSFRGSQVGWPRENYDSETKLIFEFFPCVKADVTHDYRNKTELTFGLNSEGERMAGFRIGRYRDKTVQVESAKIVPLQMPQISSALPEVEDFIKNSKFEPYSPATYEGFELLRSKIV